jgi:hypothetical protein
MRTLSLDGFLYALAMFASGATEILATTNETNES